MADHLFAGERASLFQLLHFNIRSGLQEVSDPSQTSDIAPYSIPPILPPEIWTCILEYVFEPSYADYKRCNSFYYPTYQARHLWPKTLGDEEQRQLAVECENARLVCKAWAEITRSFRVVIFKDQGLEELQGVRKMVIKYNKKDLHTVLEMSKATSSLRDLVLYGDDRTVVSYIEAIDTLLDNSDRFPHLRSLSIASFQAPNNFWNRLNGAFPFLDSLTLMYQVGQPGSVSFTQLQILDIIWDSNITFNLPSLKHCSIRILRSMKSISPFLLAHGGCLQSLLLTQMSARTSILPDAIPNTSLWTVCPNLETLGCSILYIGHLGAPPANHPLNYLHITIDHWAKNGIIGTEPRIQVILKVIKTLGVKFVSTEFKRLTEGELAELRSYCGEAGISFKWVPIPAWSQEK